MVRSLLLERLLGEDVARAEEHERRRALGHKRLPDEGRAASTVSICTCENLQAGQGERRVRGGAHLNACSSLDMFVLCLSSASHFERAVSDSDSGSTLSLCAGDGCAFVLRRIGSDSSLSSSVVGGPARGDRG